MSTSPLEPTEIVSMAHRFGLEITAKVLWALENGVPSVSLVGSCAGLPGIRAFRTLQPFTVIDTNVPTSSASMSRRDIRKATHPICVPLSLTDDRTVLVVQSPSKTSAEKATCRITLGAVFKVEPNVTYVPCRLRDGTLRLIAVTTREVEAKQELYAARPDRERRNALALGMKRFALRQPADPMLRRVLAIVRTTAMPSGTVVDEGEEVEVSEDSGTEDFGTKRSRELEDEGEGEEAVAEGTGTKRSRELDGEGEGEEEAVVIRPSPAKRARLEHTSSPVPDPPAPAPEPEPPLLITIPATPPPPPTNDNDPDMVRRMLRLHHVPNAVAEMIVGEGAVNLGLLKFAPGLPFWTKLPAFQQAAIRATYQISIPK